MKKIRNFLAALPFLLLVAGCGKFKEPEYRSYRNFRIGTLGLQKSELKLDLVYYNPNTFGFRVKSSDADVYVDSIYLGRSRLDTSVRVNSHSEFTLPVSVDIDISAILNNSLYSYLGRDVAVRATGTLVAGKNGIYKTFPIDYSDTLRFGY